MVTFAKIHLYLTWKLHSGTNKDEVDSPLWYGIVKSLIMQITCLAPQPCETKFVEKTKKNPDGQCLMHYS